MMSAGPDGTIAGAVAYATAHSPHYRAVLGDEALGATDLDLVGLPFTTPAELAAGSSQFQAVEACTVYASSGTTGRPKYSFFSRADHDATVARTVWAMRRAGCGPEDVVGVAHGFGIWLIGADFARAAEELGALVLPVGKGPTSDYVLNILQTFKATVVASSPSYLRRLAARAEELGLALPATRTLLLSGETIAPAARRHLAEVWSAQRVVSIYGSAECGTLATETGDGAILELACGAFAFEVVDPATHERVAVGEDGELVLTTLRQEGMPLIRYRTGDLVGLMASAGGLATHVVMRGRLDEAVVLESGEKLWPHQIDDALKEFPEIVAWQGSVAERPSDGAWLSEHDVLMVEVVASPEGSATTELLQVARVAIEACSLDMTAAAQATVIVEVTAIDAARLRGADGSKATRLVDLRHFPTVRASPPGSS